MNNVWEKVSVFLGGLSLIVAIVAFATPEVRCFFNLRSESCSAVSEQKPGTITTPSKVGTDYTKLQSLLAAKKFKEADEETKKLIFRINNQQEEEYLNIENVKKFPCTDFHTVNNLWLSNSNNKFGFSEQNNIFEVEFGKELAIRNFATIRKLSKNEVLEINLKIFKDSWDAFVSQVGWKKDTFVWNDKDLIYDLRAPRGHFPAKVFLHCTKGFFSEHCLGSDFSAGDESSLSFGQFYNFMKRFRECKIDKSNIHAK